MQAKQCGHRSTDGSGQCPCCDYPLLPAVVVEHCPECGLPAKSVHPTAFNAPSSLRRVTRSLHLIYFWTAAIQLLTLGSMHITDSLSPGAPIRIDLLSLVLQWECVLIAANSIIAFSLIRSRLWLRCRSTKTQFWIVVASYLFAMSQFLLLFYIWT